MNDSVHEDFMLRALETARTNRNHPFGAVIVDTGFHAVAASGVNRVGSNPILHGEIDAINNYTATNENRWSCMTLYTTAEPCPMCMSAILWSGIRTVVFGTSIPTLKRLGWNQINVRAADIVANSHRPDVEVVCGVLEGECDRLFRQAADRRKAS